MKFNCFLLSKNKLGCCNAKQVSFLRIFTIFRQATTNKQKLFFKSVRTMLKIHKEFGPQTESFTSLTAMIYTLHMFAIA